MDAPPASASWTLPALGLAALVGVVAVGWAPGLFMVDDAWFYLQIGENIASGRGSTFDGVTPTNGYHPLWQAVVAALALITGRDALLGAVVATQVALAFAALAGAHGLGRSVDAPVPEALVAALIVTQLTDQGWGSEGMLTAALHVAALSSWTRPASAPVRTGVLLGLLFLARLDTVFLVGAVLAATARRSVAEAVRTAGASACVALPWVGWTVWTTGHLVPVSGRVKSTFPVPDLSDPLEKLGWTGLVCAVGCVVGLVLAAREPDGRRRDLLGALAMGGLVHALYVGLFTGPRWSTFVAYYWITATLATGMVAGDLLVRYLAFLPSLSDGLKRALVGGAVATLAWSGTGRAWTSVLGSAPDPVVALADWMRTGLPPDAVVLTLDAPGRLAWFSGRPVIAVDGLTRDHGFSQALERDGIEAWAHAHGVTHAVIYEVPIELPWCTVQVVPDAISVGFRAPRTRADVGTVRFGPPWVKRLSDFSDGPSQAALVRWPARTP